METAKLEVDVNEEDVQLIVPCTNELEIVLFN